VNTLPLPRVDFQSGTTAASEKNPLHQRNPNMEDPENTTNDTVIEMEVDDDMIGTQQTTEEEKSSPVLEDIAMELSRHLDEKMKTAAPTPEKSGLLKSRASCDDPNHAGAYHRLVASHIKEPKECLYQTLQISERHTENTNDSSLQAAVCSLFCRQIGTIQG
jgi:hypothetical protein